MGFGDGVVDGFVDWVVDGVVDEVVDGAVEGVPIIRRTVIKKDFCIRLDGCLCDNEYATIRLHFTSYRVRFSRFSVIYEAHAALRF